MAARRADKRTGAARSGTQTRQQVRVHLDAMPAWIAAVEVGASSLGMSRAGWIHLACERALVAQGIYLCTWCGAEYARGDDACARCASVV